MSTRRNGYPALIIRSTLLIGYLFLFAAQSNYQYFDLANFFVYGHDAASSPSRAQYEHAAGTAIAAQQKQTPQHLVSLQGEHQRIGHLGMDKRYKFQQGLRMPPIRAPGEIGYVVADIQYYTCTPVYSSADLPINALRGPPSAA